MTQELKACPFCGGDAQAWTPQDAFEVFCRSCGCGTSLQETREAAVTAWNTRAPDSVIAELVEAGKRIQAHNLCGDFTVHTGECAVAFGAFQEALAKLEASK